MSATNPSRLIVSDSDIESVSSSLSLVKTAPNAEMQSLFTNSRHLAHSISIVNLREPSTFMNSKPDVKEPSNMTSSLTTFVDASLTAIFSFISIVFIAPDLLNKSLQSMSEYFDN